METKKLIEYLKRQKHVRLAYIFGSVAKGTESKLSDIDIAIFLDERMSKPKRFEQRLKLISEISSVLKSNDIDLIVMNDAPINLNQEIIKNGRVLIARREEERVQLESEILSKYLDRVYYERRGLNDFLEKILRRGKL
jgi:hypothetical protein